MKILIEGNILDVLVKEYDFEGKQGISNKLVLYCEGKLFHVKIKSSDVEYYKKLIGQDIALECKLFIDGKCSLSVA